MGLPQNLIPPLGPPRGGPKGSQRVPGGPREFGEDLMRPKIEKKFILFSSIFNVEGQFQRYLPKTSWKYRPIKFYKINLIGFFVKFDGPSGLSEIFVGAKYNRVNIFYAFLGLLTLWGHKNKLLSIIQSEYLNDTYFHLKTCSIN